MTLTETVNRLKFKYLLQAGVDATHLWVPRRRSIMKRFCEDLVDEIGASETGSVPYVFHCLESGEREFSFCDLTVRTYSGDDLGVGRVLD